MIRSLHVGPITARKLSRNAQTIVFAAIVLLLTSVTAWTQITSGTILGTVEDPSGNVVAAAKVTAINAATGDGRTVLTDNTGGFLFASMLPGTYTLMVENPGFQRYEKKGINLTAAERLTLGNLRLTIGSVNETISVVAEGARVQAASSEGSAVLTSNQLDTIAQKGRVVTNYLLLLPGISTNGGTLDAASGFITLPNANGLPNTMMTVSIDNMQGEDAGSQNLFVQSTPPDAIAEMTVLTNNFQAEFGRMGGGVSVNVVTKSGSKNFHGTAYYFKRNEALNANTFFNNRQGIKRGLYRYTTEGVSIGGPITIPHHFNSDRQKLFFFYNYDSTPSTTNSTVTGTMPTALERNGDFSQSFSSAGKLLTVTDPLNHAPFAGNLIPLNRINSQGQILENIFSVPNQLNKSVTNGAYNYQLQYFSPHKRPTHLFRVDYQATSKDTLYFRGTHFQTGDYHGDLSNFDFSYDDFVYPSKQASFGWTHLVTPMIVNEFTSGVRRPHEETFADDNRGYRKTYNLTLGQFHPEINYSDLLPLVSLTGAGLQNTPSFGSWQAGRYPQFEGDFLYYIQDSATISRNKHTFKMGYFFEHDLIVSSTGFTTTPYGSFSFNVDTNNPNDSGHPFANLLLGNFDSYTESTSRTRPAGKSMDMEWFVQDSWKATKKLTLEIGLRSVYYTQWYHWYGLNTTFSLVRYDPTQAPKLYLPDIVNGQSVALNPLNGTTTLGALAGSFIPGTGNTADGGVVSADQTYPHGYIKNPGQLLQPRFGFAYDVSGDGKTAIRGGFSVQNQLLRYEPGGAGPPITYTPVYYYGNLATFLSSGGSGNLAPGTTTGVQIDRPTPRIYNVSMGVQRDLGFKTILDAKYVSTLGRDLGTTRALETLPYGTRFQPSSINPLTNQLYPNQFLVPLPGYTGITMREAGGSSYYHSLQASANRRFSRGLNFGVAYTFSKAMDYGSTIPLYNSARTWSFGKSSFDQTHMFVVNYTYELPNLSKVVASPVVKYMFDNWEISGVTTFSSGVPATIGLTLTDGADLTGGGDGQHVNLIGTPTLDHGNRTFYQMFNTGVPIGCTTCISTVFARPGKNDRGNAGNGIVRGPGINNWDMTLFKRFPIKSDVRILEFRWEFYNILNHTQFSSINTAAQFNAQGVMTNAAFGQATAARPNRIMQGSLRFRF